MLKAAHAPSPQIAHSILSEGQAEFSASFAAKRAAGRFAGVATIESQSGVPLLTGAIAFIEGAVTTPHPDSPRG